MQVSWVPKKDQWFGICHQKIFISAENQKLLTILVLECMLMCACVFVLFQMIASSHSQMLATLCSTIALFQYLLFMLFSSSTASCADIGDPMCNAWLSTQWLRYRLHRASYTKVLVPQYDPDKDGSGDLDDLAQLTGEKRGDSLYVFMFLSF